MKKQTNLSRPHAGKLSLNKKTISNLSSEEMDKHIGGRTLTCLLTCGQHCNWPTAKGNTCNNKCGY